MRSAVIVLCLAAGGAVSVVESRQASTGDVVARSRAVFAALKSYSDTGTVVTESQTGGAPAVTERHTFRTFYRAPRHFYFEFNEDKEAGGDRYVVWGDDVAFHSWWSATGVQETFPKGKGNSAFNLSLMPTQGSILIIPPLLFSQAGLEGPIVNLTGATPAGVEDVAGRRCHKIGGAARLPYARATDRGRPTTVWIDAETSLVCRIFQDTPAGTPVGSAQRVTVTFAPQVNPAIDDARFLFQPPRRVSVGST